MSRPESAGRRIWPIFVASGAIVGLIVAGGILWVIRGSSPVPGAPTGLVADAVTCPPPACPNMESSVTLRWAPPSTGARATGYRVVRDGAPLPDAEALAPTATSLIDHAVTFGRSYAYRVVALGSMGVSAPADVSVTTPLPAPEAAQLGGVYDVSLVVVHASNLRSFGGISHARPGVRADAVWGFTPTCPSTSVACPATWQADRGTVTPEPLGWSGTLKGPAAPCPGGGSRPAPIRLRLRASRPTAADGAWVVGGFTGRYTVTFRCPGAPPSRGVLDVTGVRR
jgi:hypothetical protein